MNHPKPHIHGWKPFPLTAVSPHGWLRTFLENQRKGLTGHLEVAGYPFNTKGWLSDHLRMSKQSLAGWWPYEQYAYWVDGMISCGILLDNKRLKKKARRQIDHVLNNPDPDGYLGPAAMKIMKAKYDSARWPHAVFFRAIVADYQDRPSKTTVKKMINHYLSDTALHDTNRNVCNIEIMAWLYEQTGDLRMRDMAERAYHDFQKNDAHDGASLKNMRSNKRIGDHGPRHMELFKLGAVMHRVTGNREYLDASINANKKLIRDHMLIDGVPSTTEHLRGIYSTAGHETCVITDYLWALGYLLQATGDAAYGDAMERICFNALPGAVTHDFKALQYFSGPNQVIAGPQTNHHPHGTACAHISYRPNPATECCPGNVHRAMPAYIGRMWMDDGKGGVAACLYGPGELKTKVGGRTIKISQETDYPFSDTIVFTFLCQKPVKMKFRFRIPGWCNTAGGKFNGRKISQTMAPGTFVTLDKTFKNGDRLELLFPRECNVVKGPEKGVGIEYGPLVMALKIQEKRSIEKDDRSSKEFPAWTLEPDSAWNYALVDDRDVEIVESGITGNPWRAGSEPLRMFVSARRVPGWRLIKKKSYTRRHGKRTWVHKGNIAFMTKLPGASAISRASKKEHIVELVPYGCTNLRVSWFPVIS